MPQGTEDSSGEFWIPASSVPALAWILDDDLRILRVNRVPAAGAGEPFAAAGRRFRDLVPLAHRRAFDHDAQAVRKQRGGWMDVPLGESLRTAAWYRFHFSRGTPDGREGYVALGFEAGEMHRLRRKYDLVLSVSSRLSSILELDPLLGEVVKACKETFGFYNVNIGLVDGEEVVIRAGYGGYGGRPDGFYEGQTRFRIGGPGILAHVAAAGKPYYTPDVREDPVFAFFDPLANVVSEAAVPLKAMERVVGVLDVESDRVAGIGPEDLAVLEALAGPIAVAVENANLYVAVRKAARRYYDLYENAPDMYHTAAPDGTILECNRIEADKLGFAKAEIVGRKAEDLFAEDSRHLVARVLREVLETGQEVEAFDARMKRRDGSLLDVAVTVSPVRDESGAVAGSRAILKDVTDRVSLERQVVQAQKMESMGALAGGIAHDFNNLLGSVLGFTSYLKTQVPEGSEVHQCLDVIEQTVERGTEITDRLQAFSRSRDAERKEVDLRAIVDGVFELLKRTFERTIELRKDLEAELPILAGDPGQIQQVLMNLCLNARDAMPGGGVISMSAAAFPAPLLKPRIRLPVPAARWVALDVSDTGVGIPPEHMEKIFDPFFTTKPKGKGTGLGLAISYSIVKRHNGLILVESRIGHGSRFRILLPVPDAAPGPAPLPAPAAAAGPAPAAGGRGETVLVVDDEKNIQKFVSLTLGGQGYRVLTASGGAEALALLSRRDPAVDLLILDLAMPEMSGEELWERVRTTRPGMRCIVSSGFQTPDRASRLRAAGVNAFLPKPYAVEQLCGLVRQVLDRPGIGDGPAGGVAPPAAQPTGSGNAE